MTIVSFELDNIHETYKRLKYTKLIPCNCEVCKERATPHFYALDVLQKFIQDNEQIQCQISYRMVDVRGLIDDVLIAKAVEKETGPAGNFVFQGPVSRILIQQAQGGSNILSEDKGMSQPVRSAWANGSFYLFTFAVVIAGLAVLARTVSPYVLGGLLFAAIIFVPLIGVLQLKQDDRLTEKSFVELLKLVLGQLPLIGRMFGRTDHSTP
jgi:hypothetical protein